MPGPDLGRRCIESYVCDSGRTKGEQLSQQANSRGNGRLDLTARAIRFLWGVESESSSWSAMVTDRVSCEDNGKRRSEGEGKYSG